MDPVTGIAFALGAASFLIDVFDKSVQAYCIYSVAKSLGQDSAHLVAMLLIEERRLIQWGDGVGLKPAPERPSNQPKMPLDPRLREGTELYSTVIRILGCIEDTLTDIANLRSRYGFQIVEEQQSQDPRHAVMPQNPYLPTRLKVEAEVSQRHPVPSPLLKANLDQSKVASNSIPRFRKLKWAIKDKKGFEKFLGLLRYYNDSLQSILPKIDVSTINSDPTMRSKAPLTHGTALQRRRTLLHL